MGKEDWRIRWYDWAHKNGTNYIVASVVHAVAGALILWGILAILHIYIEVKIIHYGK